MRRGLVNWVGELEEGAEEGGGGRGGVRRGGWGGEGRGRRGGEGREKCLYQEPESG